MSVDKHTVLGQGTVVLNNIPVVKPPVEDVKVMPPSSDEIYLAAAELKSVHSCYGSPNWTFEASRSQEVGYMQRPRVVREAAFALLERNK